MLNICSFCGCVEFVLVLNNNNLILLVFKVYIEISDDFDYYELFDLIGEFDMFDGFLLFIVKICYGSSLK